MAIALRTLIQESCDTQGFVPGEHNRGIIVLIPEKWDLSLPDNYRGITLIQGSITLVMKVVSIRMYLICKDHRILVKKLAGLRTREELIPQATSLYEITQRQKLANASTFMCFFEFA